MIFDWYKIFNLTEFEALGLVSREYTLDFEDLGEQTVLVTKGNTVGLLYNTFFLSIDLNSENPFYFDGYAVYKDDNNDIYLGIEVDES